MCDKCCATCGMRYYVDDDTVCCHHDPGCGVKPNAAGFYCFNIKQAEKSCCDHYWEQIVDHRYSTMDRVTWELVFHPELNSEYQKYVEKMAAKRESDHVYIVMFDYPDVGGMMDSAEIKYADRAKAIEAAVRESKRPYNESVSLKHEWWNNECGRKECEWIDWEKEAKDGQAV